jgi:trk system potassium uptake protein TrkA
MSKQNPIYVILVGGGKVGYYLTKELLAAGHEVVLVDKDPRVVSRLTEVFGETVVLGDGCEVRTMSEIGMARANVVVAVTGDDEDNLVICQMAKRKFHVPRTIARVNDPKNEVLLKELGIDQTVNSTRIIYNLLEQQIESGEVIPLAALKKGEIEVVEVDIHEGSPADQMKVGQLDLPPNTVIISIIRDDHAILPHADTKLRVGDSAIVLLKTGRDKDLRSVFSA